MKLLCLLPTVYCLLPTVYCLLSTAYCFYGAIVIRTTDASGIR